MKKLGLLLLFVAGCGNGVSLQSGAQACITAAACNITVGGVSSCTQFVGLVNDDAVAAAAHLSPAEVNCIASAGSNCATAKKCIAGGNTPATCSGAATSCVGNSWQQCNAAAGSAGNNGIQTFDCSSVGEMCVTNNGNTDCGFGTCSVGAAACNGDTVQTCDNGILQQTDCGSISASCNPSGIGAHCRGNGAACTSRSLADNTLRCDGSVLVTCEDGQEARQDCARYNLSCYTSSGSTAFACAAGTECDPGTFGAICTGTKLQFCNKGVKQTIDCKQLGFSACNPNNGGTCGN
ncbi:MAG TPA: hypothetical protein VGL86_26295 [Polyangia bacterium]|jgi:hypothetical protein